MCEIAIAKSNGDRGGKKKKGSMSSVRSKPDRKLEKEKKEREWKEHILDKIQWFRGIL